MGASLGADDPLMDDRPPPNRGRCLASAAHARFPAAASSRCSSPAPTRAPALKGWKTCFRESTVSSSLRPRRTGAAIVGLTAAQLAEYLTDPPATYCADTPRPSTPSRRDPSGDVFFTVGAGASCRPRALQRLQSWVATMTSRTQEDHSMPEAPTCPSAAAPVAAPTAAHARCPLTRASARDADAALLRALEA